MNCMNIHISKYVCIIITFIKIDSFLCLNIARPPPPHKHLSPSTQTTTSKESSNIESKKNRNLKQHY